jgi:hypothetical protein
MRSWLLLYEKPPPTAHPVMPSLWKTDGSPDSFRPHSGKRHFSEAGRVSTGPLKFRLCIPAYRSRNGYQRPTGTQVMKAQTSHIPERQRFLH